MSRGFGTSGWPLRGWPRTLLALTLAGLALPATACRRSRPALQRGDAAVVLLAAPVPTPAGLLPISEREPTSPGEGPMALPFAGSPGLAVVGTLSPAAQPADDEDLFAIDIPGPPAPDGSAAPPDAAAPLTRALAIEVAPTTTLATRLELREADGPLLGSSAGGAGERHGLPNVAIRPGKRYLISLRRDRRPRTPAPDPAAASYTLLVRETVLGAGDEREPNDSPETATAFPPAHVSPEMAGYFGTARDRDYYRVPIGEASDVTAVTVFLTPPSSVTAILTVLDRSGAKLQEARGRTGERIVLHALSPMALSPPTLAGPAPHFYVSAETEGVADLDHRYVLGVRSEPAPTGEREPNDQPVRATLVSPGSTTGFLGRGDVDFFRCEIPAGGTVSVDVTPPRRVDVVLELLVPGAMRPLRSDGARRGLPEHLAATGAAGGPALIRVQGRRNTDYDVEEPYALTVTLGSSPGTPGETPAP